MIKTIDEINSEFVAEVIREGEHPGKRRSAAGVVSGLVFYAFLAAVVLIAFAWPGGSGAEPKSVLGYSYFTVATGSMKDEIPVGSLVVTHRTEPENLKIGDNITYMRSANTTVTHKIVGIYENHGGEGARGFQTKGTNNPQPDKEIVAAANVVGKVVLVAPGVGRVLSLVRDNIAFVPIFLGLLLLLSFSLRSFGRARRGERADKRVASIEKIKYLERRRSMRGFDENLGRRVSAAVAALTVVAFMGTATLAYYANVSVENIFSGSKAPEQHDLPLVVLHDDFDPDAGHKDVYVENTGSPEDALFVRIKLNEFLELTADARPETIDGADWLAHVPLYADEAYHYEDCGNATVAGHKFHDYFVWTLGGQKWYMPASMMTGEHAAYNKGVYVNDATDYSGLSPEERDELGLRQTLYANIIWIGEYLYGLSEEDQLAYVGWIYDADGWAYWSRPLMGGEATGLLLGGVAINMGALDNTAYCYIIDVIMDAVDEADLPMWMDDADSVDPEIAGKAEQASEEAKQALEIVKSL
ncbi:MAG: signal peptidase I [Clostridiales bacterium]|nr:signal peptidase I [Clostridiales bacterium]